MNFRDSTHDSNNATYITKRVLLNGQFVTLYSINGQTWLSSPEDIPALMERLDNSRVTLNLGEKDKDSATENGAKAAAEPSKDKKAVEGESDDTSKRPLAAKYKVKGPKQRPILRQDGIVITGTPVETISASSTALSFSSDPDYLEADAKMMLRSNAAGDNKKASKKVIDTKGKGHKRERDCKPVDAPAKKAPQVRNDTAIKLAQEEREGAKAVGANHSTKNKRSGGVVSQSIKAASKQNREAKRAIQAAAAATSSSDNNNKKDKNNINRARGAKVRASASKNGTPESAKKVKANKKVANKRAKSVPQRKAKSTSKARLSKGSLKRSQGGEGRSRSARAMTAKEKGGRSLR